MKILRSVFGGFKMRYLPLLMVYFAYGAQGVSGIAESFWVKEHLQLSAAALAGVAFWVNVPWTMKIVAGQFADSIRIFGSQRKIYVFIGAGLQIASVSVLVRLAGGLGWLMEQAFAQRIVSALPALSQGQLYLVSMVLAAAGFMLQDVVADTMTTEVVDRVDPVTGAPRSEEEINAELGQVQWLGRLFLMTAGIFTSGILSGWLAASFSTQTVFTIKYAVPLISLVGILFVRLNPVPRSAINWRILGGGLAFGIFTVSVGLFLRSYSQEVVFVVSLCILVYLIGRVGSGRPLAFAAATLFIFRAMPGYGPGAQWWMIDVLKFDQAFFGTLAQMTSILGIAGLLIFRRTITERPLKFTLLWLTVIGSVVSLPTIGLYYGLHTMIGVSARSVAIFDTAITAPLGQLSMIPMLVIIARSCPAGQAATQFALMASLMNVALSAADLGTRYLNKMYVVRQEQVDSAGAVVQQADYTQLGHIMGISWVIGLVVPVIAILLLLRKTDAAERAPAQNASS